MARIYSLGINSSDAITLYPEWGGYIEPVKMNRSKYRSKSGKLYMYKYYTFQTFSIPVNWVQNSNASIINSWWQSQTALLFFVEDGGTTDVYSSYIMNDSSPLNALNKPYTNYFKGTIKLEG